MKPILINDILHFDETDLKNINKILDLLDDDDDVQVVYHNWEE